MTFVRGISSLTCTECRGERRQRKEQFSNWMHQSIEECFRSQPSLAIPFGHLERNSVVLRNRIILSYPFVWNGIVFHTGLDEMALFYSQWKEKYHNFLSTKNSAKNGESGYDRRGNLLNSRNIREEFIWGCIQSPRQFD